MDKEKIYYETLSKIESVVQGGMQDITDNDINPRTRILNLQYRSGKIHGYLDIIEDYCGLDYQIKAYEIAKEFLETSLKICDGLYTNYVSI